VARYRLEELSANPHFRYIESTWVPWTPLVKPLEQCVVALVTTGGFYMPATQPAFSDHENRGDHTFRIIPRGASDGALAIAHTHYDHTNVKADLNSLFPLEHFRSLAAEGVVGGLSAEHYSFMGSIPDPALLLADSAPEVASRMRAAGVDVAILSAA
jgi:hypothetical protein